MEVDRHLPEHTESFAPVAPEARPGVRLLDRFPDRVEFHGTEGLLDERSLEAYRTELNTVLTEAREQPGTVICAVDASLPNEEHRHAVSAALLFRGVERVHTAIHPAGRVTAPDAELFAIRSAVCLAVQQDNCERIVVFTDSLTSAKRAVDPTLHSGQGHSLAVCRALEPWLAEDADCSITFIQVPSKLKWKIHQEAHDECRAFNAPAVQHPSTSLDSVRRAVTKSVQEDWKILFRDPVYRGHNFLMLQRPDETVLEPSYINGGTWLPAAGGDLHLAVRICRCILNHAPIGAYYERFNIPERTSCTCEDHPLETRDHILRHCGQYQRDEDGPPPRYC
ncbi:hypothetical protein D9613_011208 [Agrocybe pediades]|uniref:RNase H type-1 domain-containing protein n=1 Tax=Agrocybe pediades TaxID=84607 RepID=A0A8H4QLF2_9AGAR|nr:hypothetical protein D9613_011208 [Agrocybe pediades]